MNSHDSFDIVVIGAGPGGLAAAMQAATRGRRVALINKSHLLGYGLHGAYKSKSMWELAKDHLVASREGRGYEPSKTTCVNFREIREQLHTGAQELSQLYLQQMSAVGIEFIPGHGRLLDPHHVQVGDRTIEARSFIIATGTKPRVLPGMTVDGVYVLTSDHVVDIQRGFSSIIILGAGVIGCEFASIFAAFGVDVQLVDSQPRVLSTEDEDVSLFLEQVYRDSGVRVRQGRRVKTVEKVDDQVRTVLDDGTETFTDAALIAIGRIPATQDLGLDEAGVDMDPRGYITVDGHMQTSQPNIYAIGDVAHRRDAEDICLVHVAEAEGRHSVEAILGDERTLTYGHVPFIIFTHPMIAGVGESEQSAKRKYGDDVRVVKYENIRNHRLHAMRSFDGFVKLIVSPEGDDQVLGIRAVGPQADTLVGPISLMIDHRIPYTDLLRSLHAHPSLSESLQNAARVLAGQLPELS